MVSLRLIVRKVRIDKFINDFFIINIIVIVKIFWTFAFGSLMSSQVSIQSAGLYNSSAANEANMIPLPCVDFHMSISATRLIESLLTM